MARHVGIWTQMCVLVCSLELMNQRHPLSFCAMTRVLKHSENAHWTKPAQKRPPEVKVAKALLLLQHTGLQLPDYSPQQEKELDVLGRRQKRKEFLSRWEWIWAGRWMRGCNSGGRKRLKGTLIFKIKLRFQLLFVPAGGFTATIKNSSSTLRLPVFSWENKESKLSLLSHRSLFRNCDI